MKFKIILLILSGILCLNTFSQDSLKHHISVLFAGDLMGHDGQIKSAFDPSTGTYSYDTCFSMIRDLVSSADLAVLNLEVTLAGEPYKGYPQFSSPDAVAIAAKNAGFDIFINANNHALDGGKNGVERTIRVLDENGIIHTGTFRDEQERQEKYPLIVEKNNIRLAFLNYTYGTNGLVVKPPNIINYIDTALILTDLARAKQQSPDFIFVTLHWGKEYERTENKEQRDLAAFLFKNGADAVIGSHPHVIQPIRKYYNYPEDSSRYNLVVYSLGNFISNQGDRYRDGGLMVKLELEKTDITKITEYTTHPVFVYKPDKPGGSNYFILLPTNDLDSMVRRLKVPEGDRMYYRIFRDDTEEKLAE
jgi:poly-gamma-glutamate capsule biosynthesis protein CapA/YwtB (metallophosphatase superfamily)